VSQTGVVARLAVRELWISFRLLALLVAYVGVGALVALLPAPAATVLARLSVGLTAAMIMGAGIAADALSTERVLGRAGWLVTRSITRGTVVVGWFLALAGVSLVGLGAAAMLGWLAATASVPTLQPTPYAAVIGGVAALSLAAVAMGLLFGVVLTPLPAMLAAVVVGGLVVAMAHLILPTGAVPLTALGELATLNRPVGVGVQGAGIGLAITAVMLVLARVALGRVDL
jgi:hypothetical protein